MAPPFMRETVGSCSLTGRYWGSWCAKRGVRPPLWGMRREKSVSKESRPRCSYSVKEVTMKIPPLFGMT